MKRIACSLFLSLLLAAGISCSKIDNYPAPSQTVTGTVTDSASGKPVQTETGGNGTRIKLLEISWSADPTPIYLESMQNGTYTDTKLFAGTDKMTAEGAFVPMVQTNAAGAAIVDQSQTIHIKGSITSVNFKVQQYLEVQWAGTPVVNKDSTITCQVKITRGTSNPGFQQNLTDVFLFISNTKYDGNNNYDPNISHQITYNGTDGNAILGQTLSITTHGKTLPGGRDYFLRVGARTAYGLNQYNYTEPVEVTIP